MTEHEWLSCSTPEPMLAFLRNSGKASDRKLRLFAVACCRRVWNLIPDGSCRRAVDVADQYAEGLATAAELEASRGAAWQEVEGFDSAARRAEQEPWPQARSAWRSD